MIGGIVSNLNTNLYEFIREFIDRLLELLGLKKPEEKKVEYKTEERKIEKHEEPPLANPERFRERCRSLLGGEVYAYRCPEGYEARETFNDLVCCVPLETYGAVYPCNICLQEKWVILVKLDAERCVCKPPEKVEPTGSPQVYEEIRETIAERVSE